MVTQTDFSTIQNKFSTRFKLNNVKKTPSMKYGNNVVMEDRLAGAAVSGEPLLK